MEYELYHHGIKGQKWGVRRYQNKDGSLTPAGKKRYGDAADVVSAKTEYKKAKKAYSKAYDKAYNGSVGFLSPIKKHRENAQKRWDDAETKASEMKTAKSKLRTAEAEFKGKKLEQASNEYRDKMLQKYLGKDPQKAAFYTNASDELIQQEFIRRQNVKKAVIAGAAVVGIGAACVIAYKMSANKQIQGLGDKVTTEAAKNALKTAKEDLDYVIPKGSEIHRMVGFKDFDLSKTVGKSTYVTVNDSDRAAYALFLRDWSKTGDRYDVTLKAVKDIVAPSDNKAKEIFKQVYDSDPSYKQELEKTLIDALAQVHRVSKTNPGVRTAVDEMLKDPFGAGMYAFVRQGRDADILKDVYQKAGYNAIVDYFDRGSLGKQPMILFDAAGSTTKTGERLIKTGKGFVSELIKGEYLDYLRSDSSHPMRGRV